MSGLVPVNANAHSSVEIDDSCNDCCSCCWPRRIRPDPRKPEKALSAPALDISATSIKVHSASQPVITKSAEDEWEVTIDGQKQVLK